MSRDTFSYQHGSQGTKPSSLNFESGDYPDPEVFDWFWDTTSKRITGHAQEFDRLDSDDDGVVDEADYARDANASSYKGNDLDPDGDGTVANADTVAGVTATELSQQGGRSTLPSTNIAQGDAHVLCRYPSCPSGATLTIRSSVVSSMDFEQPSGLSVVVVDSSGTVRASFDGANYDLSESEGTVDVGNENILIAVDNGHFSGGSGQYREDVTADVGHHFE